MVILLGYLNTNPIRLGHDEDRGPGRPERARAASDVLVVGWPAEISRSADNGRFNEVDWSWAWVDLLASQIGPVSTCAPEDLASTDLSQYRYVVVSHSAVAHPDVSESLLAFEQFVNAGGVLVLERPQGTLREAFSADGRGGLRTPRAVTAVAGVGDDIAESLTQMPLFTRYVGSTAPLDGAETLLSMDGAPVVYRVSRAAGTAITIDFNLGLALVSLQQGRPTGPAFEVEPSQAEWGPTVLDLVSAPALVEADVPYGDLLAAVLVQVAMGSAAPLVTYWPYPDGVDGMVLLSHDVPSRGEHSGWLAEYEHQAGATASFYFGYGGLPDVAAVDELRESGAELGVLWERTDHPGYGNRRLLGVGGLRPLYRLATLSEHVAAVSDAMGPGFRPRGVRTRDGAWSPSWAGAFQEMAVLGLTYDSSFGLGPEIDAALPAYRHGTGRPFLVFDRNGLPFGLYEVPVVVPALSTDEQVERFEALLGASEASLHEVIGVLIPADMFEREESLARYDHWRHLLDAASEHNHLVMDVGRFVEFTHERRLSDLTSVVEEVEAPTDDDPRVRLHVRATPRQDRMWLRLPRDLGEWRLREAVIFHVTGDPPTERVEDTEVRNVSQLGVDYVLVQLVEGEQRVEVTYR